MEPALTLTFSGILAAAISWLTTYLLHRFAINDIGKVASELNFMRHTYEATLKKIEYDLTNRRKTEIVAEFFALWLQSGPAERNGIRNIFHRDFSPNDWTKLQQLSYECALWLPPEIFNDLSKRLQNLPGAKDIKEILAEVRIHLNPEIGVINPLHIIHFAGS